MGRRVRLGEQEFRVKVVTAGEKRAARFLPSTRRPSRP
jgi:hypothetical protein